MIAIIISAIGGVCIAFFFVGLLLYDEITGLQNR
jgi:hypothetical protein